MFQVVATFVVGNAVHRPVKNDFAYIGAPLLMGTVALGQAKFVKTFSPVVVCMQLARK